MDASEPASASDSGGGASKLTEKRSSGDDLLEVLPTFQSRATAPPSPLPASPPHRSARDDDVETGGGDSSTPPSTLPAALPPATAPLHSPATPRGPKAEAGGTAASSRNAAAEQHPTTVPAFSHSTDLDTTDADGAAGSSETVSAVAWLNPDNYTMGTVIASKGTSHVCSLIFLTPKFQFLFVPFKSTFCLS